MWVDSSGANALLTLTPGTDSVCAGVCVPHHLHHTPLRDPSRRWSHKGPAPRLTITVDVNFGFRRFWQDVGPVTVMPSRSPKRAVVAAQTTGTVAVRTAHADDKAGPAIDVHEPRVATCRWQRPAASPRVLHLRRRERTSRVHDPHIHVTSLAARPACARPPWLAAARAALAGWSTSSSARVPKAGGSGAASSR